MLSIRNFKVDISLQFQPKHNSLSLNWRKGKLCRFVKTILITYSDKLFVTLKVWSKLAISLMSRRVSRRTLDLRWKFVSQIHETYFWFSRMTEEWSRFSFVIIFIRKIHELTSDILSFYTNHERNHFQPNQFTD